MEIFADCADLSVMKSLANKVTGFTTNPTLMRAAGVTDYPTFARKCIKRFPNHSLSFEVVADDEATISVQAKKIALWGDNVYVKVPVTTTSGHLNTQLVHDLTHSGVKVNVTAVFTQVQINLFGTALRGGAPSYLSVFAGRIADTGVDPTTLIHNAATYARQNVRVLWASAREIINVRQAENAGADIITLTPELIKKLPTFGKDLNEFSLDTVKMFYADALAAGLSL